ncbi:hypothetical protein Tb10.389.1110 [Trypanosoma brucei brucei TREU927]|uniref:Uncharacterized protein n=1 Tax=Trypanosoma brucei brucei (strain 927/4 GUTat10.1) TaxID=185431 RepID=Q388Y7_TRYB2|nr:hypothetical protein Tb10.389.1110 [Trypanosoma brucei brucei TREU927]EAN78633.1 hypothetical protein Tb10.389.1110 [Trypanosoma brucei brucei TREU927]
MRSLFTITQGAATYKLTGEWHLGRLEAVRRRRRSCNDQAHNHRGRTTNSFEGVETAMEAEENYARSAAALVERARTFDPVDESSTTSELEKKVSQPTEQQRPANSMLSGCVVWCAAFLRH